MAEKTASRPHTRGSVRGASTLAAKVALENCTRQRAFPQRSAVLLELRLHLALLHRPSEGRVVALVLIRVCHGEGSDGLVEGVALAHVAGEHRRLSGTGVGECEGPS